MKVEAYHNFDTREIHLHAYEERNRQRYYVKPMEIVFVPEPPEGSSVPSTLVLPRREMISFLESCLEAVKDIGETVTDAKRDGLLEARTEALIETRELFKETSQLLAGELRDQREALTKLGMRE